MRAKMVSCEVVTMMYQMYVFKVKRVYQNCNLPYRRVRFLIRS